MAGGSDQVTIEGTPVVVVRSHRRLRTVSLEHTDGRYVLRAPATMAAAEVEALAERLLRRYRERHRRRTLNSDGALRHRADELNRTYFDGRLRLVDIRYVTNQRQRFGSCTPARGTIRISDELVGVPAWVRDYVIVHELAHLAEPNHGPQFWRLVQRYPLAERARGYLMALGLEGTDEASGHDAGSDDIDLAPE